MKKTVRQSIEEYIEGLDDEEKDEFYNTERGFFLPYKEDLILFLENQAATEEK
jgi:hypothetical protein